MPLSEEDCLEYVFEHAFKLRPRDYKEKYPVWPGQVGIELEHLPFSPTGQPLALHGEALSSIEIIKALPGFQTVEEKGRVLGFMHETGVNISFEPGGQFEIATPPRPCMRDAVADLEKLQATVRSAFEQKNCRLLQVGMQPWHSAEDIGLKMDKNRYQAMNRYFNRIGSYGMQMMRQTATLQVNLDFGESEEQLVNRYLFAQLVSPFASAIFANSPIKESQLSAIKSHRVEAWRYIDPCRSGLASLDFVRTRLGCAQQYTQSLLNAVVVFLRDYQEAPQGYRFRDWMSDEALNLDDFKTHMSLHFLEVRPRNFLEIRSIDAQLPKWQRVPIAMYAAMIYDENLIEKWTDILSGFDTRYLLMQARFGLDDAILQKNAKELFRDSTESFEKLPSCFKNSQIRRDMHSFYETYTAQARVPADDIVDLVRKKGEFTLDDLIKLNDLEEC